MNSAVKSIILFVIFAINSCEAPPTMPSIDGIWKNADEIIMIASNEHYYIIHQDGSDRKFISKSDDLIEMTEEGIVINFSDNNSRNYRRTPQKEELLTWAITKGMTREFMSDNFVQPDTTIISETGAEKWFYAGNNVIVFDSKGIIKIDTNYFSQRNFSSVEKGMSKNQVLSIVGNPDRINFRNTKWYYGLDYQILFREELVKDVRKINSKTGFSSWREEALATFDDDNLIKREANYLNRTTSNFSPIVGYFYDNVLRTYGVPEKKNQPLPLISIGKFDQDNFPISTQRVKNELGFLRIGIEEKLREEFKNDIVEVYVQQPLLNQHRQFIEIRASITLKTGEKIITQQAIFFRHNEMLLIQMMTLKEDEALMKYYQNILDNFDI